MQSPTATLSFTERLRAAQKTAIQAIKPQSIPKPRAVKAKVAKVKPIKEAKIVQAPVKQLSKPQASVFTRSRDKILPTRKIDYTELEAVKIDANTTVYVKPGADINTVIAKIKNREAAKVIKF